MGSKESKSKPDLSITGVQIKDASKSPQPTAPPHTMKLSPDKSPGEKHSPKTPSPRLRVPSPDAHTESKTPPPDTSKEEKVDADHKDQSDKEEEEVKANPPEEKKEIDRCAICLDDCIEPKELDKCGHVFCKDCIEPYFENIKPQCPCCFTIYGEIRGNQPEDGFMTHSVTPRRLPGFGRTSTGTIVITYHFPNGIQTDQHPNPGKSYRGTSREAYLPDNAEGRHVLELLERAFALRQTFTIGQSRTTGQDNVVTWNDIHHKTNIGGGMENFGYPDHTYLSRVQQELAAKGIK